MTPERIVSRVRSLRENFGLPSSVYFLWKLDCVDLGDEYSRLVDALEDIYRAPDNEGWVRNRAGRALGHDM